MDAWYSDSVWNQIRECYTEYAYFLIAVFGLHCTVLVTDSEINVDPVLILLLLLLHKVRYYLLWVFKSALNK